MTASKAMGALGLMNTRALEHPLTGQQSYGQNSSKLFHLRLSDRYYLLLEFDKDDNKYLHLSGTQYLQEKVITRI